MIAYSIEQVKFWKLTKDAYRKNIKNSIKPKLYFTAYIDKLTYIFKFITADKLKIIVANNNSLAVQNFGYCVIQENMIFMHAIMKNKYYKKLTVFLNTYEYEPVLKIKHFYFKYNQDDATSIKHIYNNYDVTFNINRLKIYFKVDNLKRFSHMYRMIPIALIDKKVYNDVHLTRYGLAIVENRNVPAYKYIANFKLGI